MLTGKNILLGVTGGIACYKACEIVSRLVKLGAGVDVVMTENATKLVTPKTFETLSGRPVCVDTFQRTQTYEVEHISLAKKADLVLIAPCTYNVIGKLANGIADDMLTTTVSACSAPKLICPAMNTGMYNNPICQENIAKLKGLGYEFVQPTSGRLACGDSGIGKLEEPINIVEKVQELLQVEQDLAGKRVLITGGGTEEPIDAVRVITNHSSGKMAMELASECKERGAEVTMVLGRVSVPILQGVDIITVATTKQMYDAVMKNCTDKDYYIMAAAPSDYAPKVYSVEKIKSESIHLELVKNPDIAEALGRRKGKGKLVIFSAETSNLIENAKAKRIKKHADMAVANDVTVAGAGFNVDTNVVSIIVEDQVTSYDIMTKKQVAKVIVDAMTKL